MEVYDNYARRQFILREAKYCYFLGTNSPIKKI